MQSKTKKWLVVLVGVSVFAETVIVRAQENAAQNPYRARIKSDFEALSKQMNLSDAQRQSIGNILRATMPQGRAIAQDKTLSNAQKQQKIKALRAATRGKIAALLTTVQRQSAQKLFANRQQHLRDAFTQIADELQLTGAQRREAKPIVENALWQGCAILGEGHNFSQKRAKLLQLQKITRKKLAPVLTPEQMQKFDQIRDSARAEIFFRIGQH